MEGEGEQGKAVQGSFHNLSWRVHAIWFRHPSMDTTGLRTRTESHSICSCPTFNLSAKLRISLRSEHRQKKKKKIWKAVLTPTGEWEMGYRRGLQVTMTDTVPTVFRKKAVALCGRECVAWRELETSGKGLEKQHLTACSCSVEQLPFLPQNKLKILLELRP